MPSYYNEFKESNINYLNKDFAKLKESLITYAKSYFPDTYRDFNETSPGMMLMEMQAYVGDVLSFYIDQQYREMIVPLAEERRNIVTMAKMFGYKVKPIIAAYADLTFTSEVNSNILNNDPSTIDYTDAGVFDEGIEIASTIDSNVIFSTLEPVDFTISESVDLDTISTTDADGLATTYTLERTVKAVSATEKSIAFDITTPEKFKRILIPDTNVVDIVSVIDSNGNEWYEVDFLAQDRVPISTHYLNEGRTNAYQNIVTGASEELPVPYSLEYIKTSKRFTRETNSDNTTTLVFGNGVLRDGQFVTDQFIDLEQVGIVIPGTTDELNTSIDPLMGDAYSTLGETPNNVTLTITYRIGGGMASNVPSGDLTNLPSVVPVSIGGNVVDASITTVTNAVPARGGKNEEHIDEIREKTRAFFTTQNRCVTKEDYEARIMNMPAKFGNIAKVYVTRNVEGDIGSNQLAYEDSLSSLSDISTNVASIGGILDPLNTAIYHEDATVESIQAAATDGNLTTLVGTAVTLDTQLASFSNDISTIELSNYELSSINIYILAYDDNKNLIGNPMAAYQTVGDSVPSTLISNIKNYLLNFKILTDVPAIFDGYIINFGVFFDVVAHKYANKQEVKLKCIAKIVSYFSPEKMQFNQAIFISELEYQLMGIEGVLAVNHVTISQETDYKAAMEDGQPNIPKTYTYEYNADLDTDGDGTSDGGWEATQPVGYGYKYDFNSAQHQSGGIIKPPLPSTPTVFELKNPLQNIKGRVR